MQPGPVQPGPVQPGPQHAGPQQPGPQPGAGAWASPQAGWPPVSPAGRPSGQGNRTPLIIGAVVGVLALLVAGVLVVPRLLGSSTDNPTTVAPTSSAAPAAKASDAVAAYLKAIQQGDAKTAVDLLDSPGDKTLLTADVLRAANTKAPISGVTVTPDSSDSPSSVSASYRVGTDNVTYDFPVVKRADGWRLLKGTGRLPVRGTSQRYAPVKVNGVTVPAGATDLPVFPGGYAFASASISLKLPADLSATVLTPTSVKAPNSLPWQLADPAAVVELAKMTALQCGGTKELKPPNCPFGMILKSAQTIKDPSTIKWEYKNDPWAGATPTLDPSRPTDVTVKIAPDLRLTAQVVENGRTFSGFLDLSFNSTAQVDLAIASPTVTWTYEKR